MDKREYETLENRILYTLARTDLSLMDPVKILPARFFLGENPGKSLYAIRKALKRLKDEGLVKSVCECFWDEDHEYCIVQGWQLTDKARTTGIYANAKQEEMEIRRKVFGSTFAGGKGDG